MQVEVHVDDGYRRVVSVTREVSKRGLFYFVTPAPAVGQTLEVSVVVGGEACIQLRGTVRTSIPDVGAGVQLDADPRYERWVEEIESIERIRATGGVDFEHRELVEVGVSGEAFRVLFERYPPVAIAGTPLAGDCTLDPRVAQLVEGITRERVGVKLHELDSTRYLHIAAVKGRRSFLAIVPNEESGHVFYALAGGEQIAIRADDRVLFPFFSSEDLDRIARDTSGEARASALSEWTRFDEIAQESIEQLFLLLDAETRVYNVQGEERSIRILRNLTLMIREAGTSGKNRATLLHDGKRVCALFGIRSKEPMRIRPISRNDEICIRAA